MVFTINSVLITGASRGLGLEFANQLSALPQSQSISLLRVDLHKAIMPRISLPLQTLREIAASRNNVIILRLDTLDKQTIDDSAAIVEQKLGDKGLDLIINNAGIGGSGNLLETTNEDLICVYHTNVIGPLNVVQAYHSLITKAGKTKRFAAVVNISSWLGSCKDAPIGGFYPYSLSKTALNRLTRALSYDLIGDNVIAISLNPGWVQTDLGTSRATLTAQQSINNMLKVIKALDISKNGKFINYDRRTVAW